MKRQSRSTQRRIAAQKGLPAPTFAPVAELNEEYAVSSSRGMNLVPVLGLAEEAVVYDIGAEKHGADSWRDGMPWSICLAKLIRHLGRFVDGESRCPVDGQHHMASVKFWANTLMEFEHTHPELDDIRKKA